MTAAQRESLEAHWPRFGIEPADAPLVFETIFGRQAPVRLEIGFGAGEALLAMAEARPDADFLGIEVYRPGVGRLLGQLYDRDIRNVRVICHDAIEVLTRMIPVASLEEILLFFPDPWPKKRHHKRRLVNPSFASLVAGRLRPGGRFRMATDWEDYARQAVAVLDAEPLLENLTGPGRFSARPPERAPTRFGRRGERLGLQIRDLAYKRIGGRREPEGARGLGVKKG